VHFGSPTPPRLSAANQAEQKRALGFQKRAFATTKEVRFTALACIAYPKLADKPEFNAASFLVAEVPPTTSRACLAGSKNWLTRSSQTVTINSTHFKQFFASDAWTSHRQYGEIYRVFHAWKCYELAIQEVTTAHGAYNPGTIQEFTKEDSDEVLARLREALTSFTFLK
jgi:hypothetical protein